MKQYAGFALSQLNAIGALGVLELMQLEGEVQVEAIVGERSPLSESRIVVLCKLLPPPISWWKRVVLGHDPRVGEFAAKMWQQHGVRLLAQGSDARKVSELARSALDAELGLSRMLGPRKLRRPAAAEGGPES